MRYFGPNNSQAALETAIHKAWFKLHPKEPVLYITGHDYKNLTPQVAKDLSKVKFGTENWIDKPGSHYTFDNILGYTGLHSGLNFFGVACGDDFELPVFFIIYLDHKGKLRGYIPEFGNLYNTKNRCAYGHALESDIKNACERFGYKSLTEEDMEDLEVKEAESLLIVDINSRIVPAPNSNSNQSSANKPLIPIKKRIEQLQFYSPGDEGVELFQQTCGLCYSMVGLGKDEKAETLYEWAKEMADESYEYAKTEGYEGWEKDFVKGHYGYAY